jgi:hypothetical protein
MTVVAGVSHGELSVESQISNLKPERHIDYENSRTRPRPSQVLQVQYHVLLF